MPTRKKKDRRLILDNIRSAFNVGAIFRIADCVGISKIYLSGVTPAPLDRFKRVNTAIAKTALGAEISVPWESVRSTRSVIDKLKKEKFAIVAIEQDKRAKDYKKVRVEGETLFVLGSETKGLARAILQKADVIAEIPLHGDKESLNVAVAGGIALFRMLDR